MKAKYFNKSKQRILFIVRRIWFIVVVNRWNKFWIRKNELHSSLDMSSKIMTHMSDDECEKYVIDLLRRRNIAHQREMYRTQYKTKNLNIKLWKN